MSLKNSVAIAGFAFSLATFTAQAQQYTVINLGPFGGTPGNGYGYGYGSGINATGQVTGAERPASEGPATHAFVTDATTNAMTDLGTFGGFSDEVFSAGYGVNDGGQVTGVSSFTYAGAEYAFLTDATTNTPIDLGTLGGQSSAGYEVNDSGQVAGTSYIGGDQYQHAFLYSNGVMQDLGTLGGNTSYGYGINASGQVTGSAETTAGLQDAFVTNASTSVMVDLGTLTGYTNGVGTGINASGQITGYAYSGSTTYRAFVTDATTNTMSDLGTLGGASAEGYGINDSGQVVGWSFTAAGIQHGFVYSNGQMLDLNSLLSASDAGTYTIVTAAAINDNGQIVANAYNNTVIGGDYVVLLLTPASSDAPGQSTTRPRAR